MLALANGSQNAVFRKGGILEPDGEFQPEQHQFYLYPAYDHQRVELVKPDSQNLIHESMQAHIPGQITLRYQAKVVSVHTVTALEKIHILYLDHIYTDAFFEQRLAYRPHLPLYVMQLAVNPVTCPITFVESEFQTGCKSWVPVDTDG